MDSVQLALTTQDLDGAEKLLNRIFDVVIRTEDPTPEADERILKLAMSMYDEPDALATITTALNDPAYRDAFIQGAASMLGALETLVRVMRVVATT